MNRIFVFIFAVLATGCSQQFDIARRGQSFDGTNGSLPNAGIPDLPPADLSSVDPLPPGGITSIDVEVPPSPEAPVVPNEENPPAPASAPAPSAPIASAPDAPSPNSPIVSMPPPASPPSNPPSMPPTPSTPPSVSLPNTPPSPGPIASVPNMTSDPDSLPPANPAVSPAPGAGTPNPPRVVEPNEGHEYCRIPRPSDCKKPAQLLQHVRKHKILICHKPAGMHAQNKLIPEPAWRGHSVHGDHLGACGQRPVSQPADVVYDDCE